jgi:pilus assembly protein Flp/PilA
VESIKRFIREESGVTASEYGIILGTIAAVLILGVSAFYAGLGEVFSSMAAWFVGKTPPS